VQMPFGEIDLIPLEIDGLGHTQAMASHQQDQCAVPLAVAALTSGFDELGHGASMQGSNQPKYLSESQLSRGKKAEKNRRGVEFFLAALPCSPQTSA